MPAVSSHGGASCASPSGPPCSRPRTRPVRSHNFCHPGGPDREPLPASFPAGWGTRTGPVLFLLTCRPQGPVRLRGSSCPPSPHRTGQARCPALPRPGHRIDRHQRNPYAFQATKLIPNPRDHHGQQRTFRLRLFPVPPPVRRAPHQRGQRPRPHRGERSAAARAAPQPRSRTGRAGRHPHAAPAHARHRGPHRGHGLLSAGPCHHIPGLPGSVPQKRAHRPHLHRRAAQEQQCP